MKKTSNAKLILNRETLRDLNGRELRKAAGGAPTTGCSETAYTCGLHTLPLTRCVV